jgi:DNA-binding NarL/FixJ family response regulator
MASLLIIEDHPITAMVTEEIICTVVKNQKITHIDCLADLRETSPYEVHVVLSDLILPDCKPQELFELVSSRFTHANRIFFTSMDDADMIQAIRNSGALYLSKNAKYKEIVYEIQNFLSIGSINTEIENTKNGFQSLIQRPSMPKPLTIKQAQVMEQLAEGKTVKEIGRILNLSPDTVRAHLKGAFNRLDSATRSEALKYYAEARKIAERIYGSEALLTHLDPN